MAQHPNPSFKVATYNIHKAHSVLRGCHLHELRQGLAELDADVVCLQEVQDLNHRRRAHLLTEHGHSQLSALQGDTYPHAAYGANAVYQHGHHGNAILSRYPIRRWCNIDVSDHRFEQRGILHAVVVHPLWGDIHVVCAHFGLLKGGRIRQANALIDYVRRNIRVTMPMVIAGDFNDWNLYVHRLITRELGLRDVIETTIKTQTATTDEKTIDEHEQQMIFADPLMVEWHQYPRRWMRTVGASLSRTDLSAPEKRVGRTFPSLTPWFKLDRLYVRGWQIGQAQVKSGAVWRARSDHAPIAALLYRMTTANDDT